MAQHSDVQLKPPAVLQTGAGALARREGLGLATFVRQFPAGCIGAAILVFVTFFALAAPLVTVHDPTQVKLRERKQIPSWSHPLGTDYEGRDILTRIIYGGRVSLAVSVLSVLLGTTVGALWGVASAYIGGRFDMHSQRLLEIFMSFPPLILAMMLVIGMGAGLWAVVIAIGMTRLPFGVRVVRSVALSVKELAYVGAGRAIGASHLRTLGGCIARQLLAVEVVAVVSNGGAGTGLWRCFSCHCF